MDRAESLIEEHRPLGVSRGGAVLFYWTTARTIIDRCDAECLELLGMDGFYVTADETHPAMDWILDLSAKPNAYDDARRFLDGSAGRPLFFEIVLNDPDA